MEGRVGSVVQRLRRAVFLAPPRRFAAGRTRRAVFFLAVAFRAVVFRAAAFLRVVFFRRVTALRALRAAFFAPIVTRFIVRFTARAALRRGRAVLARTSAAAAPAVAAADSATSDVALAAFPATSDT
ncbi:MAG TPA: hypothetical protein VLD67_02090, partial [Vicinamibacterales bacterium]|nr:hypothetical protein [Vicinamibacterales bacterium]